MQRESNVDLISVIVPNSPFPPANPKQKESSCLCALDVEKHLMKWWPGEPHRPEKHPAAVRAIQRSLDWKRVAQIAAYLLQEDIKNVGDLIRKHFSAIYDLKKNEPGRQWPPKVSKLIRHQKSSYPEFGDILVHINGAHLTKVNKKSRKLKFARELIIDPNRDDFKFTVIDGQHRINGAYLALKILQERSGQKSIGMELAATVYLDLDPADGPAQHQAQLFIDVNFNQKKVDRSLVYDLFPTAWGRAPKDNQERAMDLARKLMLETGPLVGMVQIPGIKYGVKGVVTLATLAGAIQGVLDMLNSAGLRELKLQADFFSQLLTAWLNASGWKETPHEDGSTIEVNPDNVVYQGRVLVSVIALAPAAIHHLKQQGLPWISDSTLAELTRWSSHVMRRANLERDGRFINKTEFRKGRFLGSGGIGRFRNMLWAATDPAFKANRFSDPSRDDGIASAAEMQRGKIYREINTTATRDE